mgnify:CR=1 FL=1
MILIVGIESKMEPVIGILDIGLGNVTSIANAVYQQGVEYLYLKNPSNIDDCTHLILPGVGHYSFGVERINESGFSGVFSKFVESGRPVMGVCLGMQLLFNGSDEGDGENGLNIFPGDFIKFSKDVRVPHMGWNEVNWSKNHPVNDEVKSGKDFYFVHSYHLKSSEYLLSTTKYYEEFVSSIVRDNVIGFQFHPEKSQKNGLKLIENFCWWDGKC